MNLNSSEICLNCIWWIGDSFAEQGECTESLKKLGIHNIRIGRYEECVKFLSRELPNIFEKISRDLV